MKATATQIGNSKKERIEIDGEVFLKSVEIGKWNYIVEIKIEEGNSAGTYYGKSRDFEKANSYTTGYESSEFHAYPHSYVEKYYTGGIEKYEKDLAEFKARPGCTKRSVRGKNGYYYTAPNKFTRTVTKIER